MARRLRDGFSLRSGAFLNSAGRTVASTDGAPTCGPAGESAGGIRTDGPVICGPTATSTAVTRTDGSAACGTVETLDAVATTDGSPACGTVATLDAVTSTEGSITESSAACGTPDTLDAVAGTGGSAACSSRIPSKTSNPSVRIGGSGMSRVARCASLARASSTPLARSVAANGATATPWCGSICTELGVESIGTVPVPMSCRGRRRFRTVALAVHCGLTKARREEGEVGAMHPASARQVVPSGSHDAAT